MVKKSGNIKKQKESSENIPDIFSKDSELPVNKKDKNSSENLNCFLFQINYSNIYPYFDRGLILPTKYFSKDEKTEFDIQSKFPNFLVLSKNKIIESKENQLFIEIILTEEEEKRLISSDISGLYFYEKPIPVSRVKNIYYTDKQVVDKVLKIVSTGGASFISDTIIEQLPVNLIEIPVIENNSISESDFNKEIVHYDKLMGMFSFMKNTNLYYGIFSNYSSNYFLALGLINQEIKKLFIGSNENPYVKSFEKIINNKDQESVSKQYFISSLYNPNIIINKDFLKDFIDKYKNEAEDSILQLENILKKINDPLAKTESLDILAKNKNLKAFFQIAYIANYGDKLGNSKQILKNTLAKEVPYSQAEIILALLGLYFGYKSLNPIDTIQISNNNEIARIIDKNANIKFRLNSRLDYITIESIYQFTFNAKSDNDFFDYLIAPEFSFDNSVFSKFQRNSNFDYSERQIFDIKFICIKQKDIKELIYKTIKERYPNKIPDFFFLVNWIRKYNSKHFLIRMGIDGEIVFKDEFLQFLEQNTITEIAFLQKCINYDVECGNVK